MPRKASSHETSTGDEVAHERGRLPEVLISGPVLHAHTGSWAASVIRERISAGELPPGAKLSEQALADSLGVSRNTLREAFTMLAGESVVRRIPNRGVFVAAPDADDVREIYRVRRVIEPGAVLWGELTPEALDTMDRIVGRARVARDQGAVGAMADANQELHQAVVALTGSHSLDTLMERVLAEMRLVFHAMAELPDFHSHYVERNARMVDQLRAGRREEAAREVRSSLDDAERELLARFEHPAEGPRGPRRS